MKKDQFIEELRGHLAQLPPEEVAEIIRDQEEFIHDAMAAGRSEEEAVRSLGDPRTFASSLQAELKMKNAEDSTSMRKQIGHTFSAMLAILALAPLNLIFVLGPFIFICAMIVAGWGTSFGLFVAAWGVLIGFFSTLVFLDVGFWTHVSAFFFMLGWIGLGSLGVLLMVQVTRFFIKATHTYLRWNLQMIQGRRN